MHHSSNIIDRYFDAMNPLEKKFSVGVVIGGQLTHLPCEGNTLMHYESAVQKAVQYIYSLSNCSEWKQTGPNELEFTRFENGMGDRITISLEEN